MIQGKESPDFLDLGKRQGRFHIQSTMSTKPPLKKGVRKRSQKLNVMLECDIGTIFYLRKEKKLKTIKQNKPFLKATDLKKQGGEAIRLDPRRASFSWTPHSLITEISGRTSSISISHSSAALWGPLLPLSSSRTKSHQRQR